MNSPLHHPKAKYILFLSALGMAVFLPQSCSPSVAVDISKATVVGSFAQFNYAYTSPSQGNPVYTGHNEILKTPFLFIPTDSEVKWVLGAESQGEIFWVSVLKGGQVQAHRVENQKLLPHPITPEKYISEAPPVLSYRGNTLQLVSPGHPKVLSAPYFVDQDKYSINEAGRLQWTREGQTKSLSQVEILPDSPLIKGGDWLYMLTSPTGVYPHGVLGDALEAKGWGRFNLKTQTFENHLLTEEKQVYEGITPFLGALTSEASPSLFLTQSNIEQGAKLLSVNTMNVKSSSSEALGQGFRWIHQLALAPTGPHQEQELIGVRTPHIGGILTYYQHQGGQWVKQAELKGFRTHKIGSRQLNTALVANFNGDSYLEVLLPTQAQDGLALLQHTAKGVQNLGDIKLKGQLSSNMLGLVTRNKTLQVGLGTTEGLFVWL